jgi:hypothetical protein
VIETQIGAFSARSAESAIKSMCSRQHRMSRANLRTITASDTLFRVITNDSIKALRFGIVTPQTAKRASLQEDRGTDTGSVVDRHSLYIEYFSHKTEISMICDGIC